MGRVENVINICNNKFCWWSPPQDWIVVTFCKNTSIHGINFMGLPKRHLTERLFWMVAFTLSVAASGMLILSMWKRYQRTPVIVTFQSKEQGIDSIPFPAVTLCSRSQFLKSKLDELEKISLQPSHPEYASAKRNLSYVSHVCRAQDNQARLILFGTYMGKHDAVIPGTSQSEMMDFIHQNTIPCHELILLCGIGLAPRCERYIKPIVTDFGKCCTFNTIALQLLFKDPDNGTSSFTNDVYWNWDPSEISWWSKWNYNKGFILNPKQKRPWKADMAGLPNGLTMMVNPTVDKYACPGSSSTGIKYVLHSPLELPHVMGFSAVFDTGLEVFAEVHPDMTMSDELRDMPLKKRQCYFNEEKSLSFFKPYTVGNCIHECTAKILEEKCNCTHYYMPRNGSTRICNNHFESLDFQCIAVIENVQVLMDKKCGHCYPLCEDIAYNFEATSSTLSIMPKSKNKSDMSDASEYTSWANKDMSILHIYFGSETIVPKLRKKLYGVVDLIGNAGGILGLCLGFSALSGIEIIYYFTLRAFCNRKWAQINIWPNAISRSVSGIFARNGAKTIQLDSKQIPVLPFRHHSYVNPGWSKLARTTKHETGIVIGKLEYTNQYDIDSIK